jgi:hypothetical protein
MSEGERDETAGGGVLTRAALRRARALVPEGDRPTLLRSLLRPETVAPLPPQRAIEALMRYLLDPLGRAILGVDDELAAWIAGSPLLRPVGPGAAAPLADDLAAVLVAPMLARAGELPEVLWRWRWSPRADELIAATVCALEPAAGQAALGRLLAPGPDEERVHQAALQAGAALVWCPHLHGTPEASAVVDALTPLLDRSSPRPLLAAVAAVLGPIARARSPLGERVRFHAFARLRNAIDAITAPAAAPAGGGFSAQLAALDAPADGELERAKRMPDWEAAEHAAHILGAASPGAGEPWSDWLERVLKLFGDLPLLAAFLDGLVTTGDGSAVAELVGTLARGDDDDRALAADLATLIPVDDAADSLRALLADPREDVRATAIDGLALIAAGGDAAALAAIEQMLADPAPEVAAAAALALVEHGHGARLREHADDPSPVRKAAIRAAAGADDTETVGELTLALVAQLADDDRREGVDGSPLLRALRAAIFTTPAGLLRCAALLGGIPESLPVVAFAAPRDDGESAGVVAPPDGVAAIEAALADVIGGGDGGAVHDSEEAALALGLVAALSCGDEALAARVAAALEATDGNAGPLVGALAELRVRSVPGAAALAPLLAAGQPLAGRVLAAAAAGRVLPADHPSWADVAALLELGTLARAAAWTSLRDRVRFGADAPTPAAN